MIAVCDNFVFLLVTDLHTCLFHQSVCKMPTDRVAQTIQCFLHSSADVAMLTGFHYPVHPFLAISTAL